MKQSLTLTQRRRIETQLEIARAAAVLFTEHGVDGVTAETIASQAGIALRTFYRYFRTKEDAVAPLFAIGASQWRSAIAASGAKDLRQAISVLMVRVLTPTEATGTEGLTWTRGLLRAAAGDPALFSVWNRVNQDSEAKLRRIIANLMGPDTPPFAVRLLASAATDSMRVALEHWSAGEIDPDGTQGVPADLARRAFEQLSQGIDI